MIKYKTVIDGSSITLGVMQKEKTFMKGEEVLENSFTECYPQYFKKIGDIEGFANLASTKFIPVKQEEKEQEEPTKLIYIDLDNISVEILNKALNSVNATTLDIISLTDIMNNIKEQITEQDIKEPVEVQLEELPDSLIQESYEEYDVKIETEEDENEN